MYINFCCRFKERKIFLNELAHYEIFISLGFILSCSYVRICFQLVAFVRERI